MCTIIDMLFQHDSSKEDRISLYQRQYTTAFKALEKAGFRPKLCEDPS